METEATQLLRKYKELDREARRLVSTPHPAIWTIPRIDIAKLIELRTLKSSGPSSVSLIQADTGEILVLKHYRPTKKIEIRDYFGYSKAIRSHLAAESIQRRGFEAIQPLASWSIPSKGSYLLLENLTRYPKLQLCLQELDHTQLHDYLYHLGRWVRNLHLAGIWYRDLKPSNILVKQLKKDLPVFVLLDHDRNIFLSRVVPRLFAVQDIAALFAGLPDSLSVDDRTVFLKHYAHDIDERQFWKKWIPLVERKSDIRRTKRKLPLLDRLGKNRFRF